MLERTRRTIGQMLVTRLQKTGEFSLLKVSAVCQGRWTERYGQTFLRYILITLTICHGACKMSLPSCRLGIPYPQRPISTKGDLLVGGIFDMHIFHSNEALNFTVPPYQQVYKLSMLNEDYYNFLALVFALDEINNNSELLPNISLGYHVYDSYVDSLRIVQNVFKLFSRSSVPILNYNCAKSVLVGIVEGLTPMFSIQVANILQIYKYPQISFTSQGSTSENYPHFYRPVPIERFLHRGILELLLQFEWKWIGIITPTDPSSMNGVEQIKNMFLAHGICTEFIETVPFINDYSTDRIRRIKETIIRSTTKVVLLYGTKNSLFHFQQYVNVLHMPGKVWISMADTSFNILYNENSLVTNGSLHFIIRKIEIPSFLNFLKEVDTDKLQEGNTFLTWWDELCANRCPFGKKSRKCHGIENGRNILNSHCNLRFQAMSYSVYNVVYALAYAIHDMLLVNKEIQKLLHMKKKMHSLQEIIPRKLHHFLRRVDFVNTLGERIHFHDNDMSTAYDIYNLVYFPNKTVSPSLVGNFTYSNNEERCFTLLKDVIIWDSNFTEIPQSICSEDCRPGYRKSPRMGQSLCCFDCLQCPEGEYSIQNNSDMCILCPKNKWSNEERTDCIPKVITFLSYQEPLGILLALGAIGFSLLSIVTLGVFLRYRDTPIVKANNRTLSYILLIALAISFLGSLLFIGHPGKWTCLLCQSIFGITFSISVSSILAKTFTVIVAFNVSRTGDSIRKYIGFKTPQLIVCFGSAVQFLICLLWLILSPPFPHYHNTTSREMLIHCYQGSIFFYSLLGYLYILAGISFIVAFIARSLPDTFNEAKYITLSMFIFIFVWISFIPCYLGSRGKVVEAVEVFAIVASSAGLLICIFVPKLKIIILQPHKNKRSNLKIETIVLQNYGS